MMPRFRADADRVAAICVRRHVRPKVRAGHGISSAARDRRRDSG
jgi:hypothetical protein